MSQMQGGDTSVKNIPANGTLAGAYYNSSDATPISHERFRQQFRQETAIRSSHGISGKQAGTNYAAGARYTNSAQIDTLYAQWTENQYTITYVSSNGNADSKVGYK